MAWSNVADNQMVSYTDALTSPFALNSGQANPGSNLCMTKNNAFTLYNLVTNANTNALASNQLMQKSFWTGSILPYSYTLIYSYFDDTFRGFESASVACSSNSIAMTVYSDSSTISVGMTLYDDVYGSSPFTGTSFNAPYPLTYYKLNNSVIRFQANGELPEDFTNNSNTVYSTSDCVIPNSVTFSNQYESDIIGLSQYSGTVTVTGDPATFRAYATIYDDPNGTVSTSALIDGTTMNADNPYGDGTVQSSNSKTLTAGTYDYSLSVTISTTPPNDDIFGGITWTQ